MSKTRKTRKTRKSVPWKGWAKLNPGTHQRTVMLKKCGRKCFLGPNKSYPICIKNTCKISKKGIYAYFACIFNTNRIRSRQYHKKNISKKATFLLNK
jgi:hypothetical protein